MFVHSFIKWLNKKAVQPNGNYPLPISMSYIFNSEVQGEQVGTYLRGVEARGVPV